MAEFIAAALQKRIEQAEQVLLTQDLPRAEQPWPIQMLDLLREEAQLALDALTVDTDYPEFEFAVWHDDVPVGLFYERAEQQLAVGGGAPSTMTDVKRLAERLQVRDAAVTRVTLLCPKCLACHWDAIQLVDTDERLNRLVVEVMDGTKQVEPFAGVIAGQSEYEDSHFLCTACMTKLSAPSGFEHHWN